MCEPGIFENIGKRSIRTFGAGPCQSASAAVGDRCRKGAERGEEEEVGQEDK